MYYYILRPLLIPTRGNVGVAANMFDLPHQCYPEEGCVIHGGERSSRTALFGSGLGEAKKMGIAENMGFSGKSWGYP